MTRQKQPLPPGEIQVYFSNEGAVLVITGAHALCGQALGSKSIGPWASKPIANSLVTCGWIREPLFFYP